MHPISINLSFQLEGAQALRFLQGLNGATPLSATKAKPEGTRVAYDRKSPTETASAKMCLGFMKSLKPGRAVPLPRIKKFFVKKGYNANSAHAVCSALYHAGLIKKVSRGVYTT